MEFSFGKVWFDRKDKFDEQIDTIKENIESLEETDNIALNHNVLERQVNFDLNLKATVQLRNESFQSSLQEKELDSQKENNQNKK